jgi:DNA-binding transcriptional regulator YdaS (Cro superfamily)
MNEIHKAIEYFGGQTALAKAIGATKGQIHMMIKRNTKLPEIFAIRIEQKSKGKLPLKIFRPDLAQALEDAGYVNSHKIYKVIEE